uniref:Uncharacterized protein n=1 Tax=Arundo donax TaxID=35708 RepID=A0A0A9BEJ4_ARUDO
MQVHHAKPLECCTQIIFGISLLNPLNYRGLSR